MSQSKQQVSKSKKRNNSKIQIGHLVKVTVDRVVPIGLLVRLPNGGVGRIREREISWSTQKNISQWSDQFQQGDEIEAVVISQDAEGIDLSLRLAEYDPWQDVLERFHEAQLYKGTVTGIEPYGAFIELQQGVTGLLHHSEIRKVGAGAVSDNFWPGDQVYVSIKKVEVQKRHISLSMMQNRSQRWHDKETTSATNIDHSPKNINWNMDGQNGANTHLLAETKYDIIVIEDDDDQRTAIVGWLRGYGHHVLGVDNAEECINAIADNEPDIIFTDVGLPGINGMEALERIFEQSAGIHCVLMTDWARGLQHAERLNMLRQRGVHFLSKPLLPDDLQLVFAAIAQYQTEQNRGGNEEAELWDDDAQIVDVTKVLVREGRFEPQYKQGLRRLLRKAKREVGASNVILFRFDKYQRQIFCEIEQGNQRMKKQSVRGLMRSPVREVAEDGRHVVISSSEKREQYAKNLLALLPFASCVGAPIQGGTPDSHALFFFFSKRTKLTTEQQNYIDVVTESTRLTLQNHFLHQQLTTAQQTSLLGTLARGFVHEVNHHLSPVNFAFDTLTQKCSAVLNSLRAETNDAEKTITEATTTLAHLGTGIQNLTKTARAFGQLVLQDNRRLIQIDKIVEQSIELVTELLNDTYKNHTTKIILHDPPQMMYTRATATQIRQVVVNVILNAVQQIQLTSSDDESFVHVSLDLESANNKSNIVLRIEDDGPGIHRRLWEKIFELGYSKRDGEGSGLGLYISRSLLKEVNGSVEVESSAIGWGTVMAIRLPVRIS